ncbi:hypothetical protein AB0E83_12415 [Streptomyces sp. NPDC035033]|uniref:hypothetical protein n=1 Tax=Streptomyces sp. NPDC035033 TaxID=3155368 RepID=UPI003406972A
MRKIITCGLLAAAALAAATPAFADNDGHFGSGADAANDWNFTAADVCLQELAVVPALSDQTGSHTDNCGNGNVIDHAAGALPLSR